MMQRGIGVGEQWTYRALLLNGCKGLSIAHFARFQVVLNGGIDRHGSYSRPLWLGNAPFRGVFSSAKKYPSCCGGEALNHATTIFGMCQCCCEE